ncbi:MAG: sigma-54-dependent Fis family transcriptional regulator [Polyangiaceae bacterium]
MVPVLITGESGTGKEVPARFVHAKSARAAGPFVAVNCGALSPALLESTLFGHRKGAFTGAIRDAPGLFVEADGGTLFLDEIGDLEIALQVKLLRALEEGEVLPVGASRPVKVDVRIVSATHRPLAKMVEERAFRDDLYWRVRGIELSLPRLADRTGDLPLLAPCLNQARALVQKGGAGAAVGGGAAAAGGARVAGEPARAAARDAAGAGDGGGAGGDPGRGPFAPELRSGRAGAAARGAGCGTQGCWGIRGRRWRRKIAALEMSEIARVLGETGGNRSQAAERWGLSRQGLLNKMARHGLR